MPTSAGSKSSNSSRLCRPRKKGPLPPDMGVRLVMTLLYLPELKIVELPPLTPPKTPTDGCLVETPNTTMKKSSQKGGN
jgi:hypothetical protein